MGDILLKVVNTHLIKLFHWGVVQVNLVGPGGHPKCNGFPSVDLVGETLLYLLTFHCNPCLGSTVYEIDFRISVNDKHSMHSGDTVMHEDVVTLLLTLTQSEHRLPLQHHLLYHLPTLIHIYLYPGNGSQVILQRHTGMDPLIQVRPHSNASSYFHQYFSQQIFPLILLVLVEVHTLSICLTCCGNDLFLPSL